MIHAGPVLHGGASVSPGPLTAAAGVSTLVDMTTATTTRPRLRQVFPDGGHLDLAPAPGDPQPVPTRDEHTAGRLALALLLARHGPGRDDGRYQCSYEALDSDGNVLAGQDDGPVCTLVEVLRGTDLGELAQFAALQTAGLAAR